MTTTEALLIGRRRRLALTMVGGFAGIVALALALAVVADLADIQTAAAVTDRLIPLLVFYAPAPIAAAGAYALRRASVSGSGRRARPRVRRARRRGHRVRRSRRGSR